MTTTTTTPRRRRSSHFSRPPARADAWDAAAPPSSRRGRRRDDGDEGDDDDDDDDDAAPAPRRGRRPREDEDDDDDAVSSSRRSPPPPRRTHRSRSPRPLDVDARLQKALERNTRSKDGGTDDATFHAKAKPPLSPDERRGKVDKSNVHRVPTKRDGAKDPLKPTVFDARSIPSRIRCG